MKKKIFSIVIIGCLVTMIGINLNFDNSIQHGFQALLDNVEALASDSEGGIDIHFGPDDCVCKKGTCRDGKYFSTRDVCGKGKSDLACGQYSYRCK